MAGLAVIVVGAQHIGMAVAAIGTGAGMLKNKLIFMGMALRAVLPGVMRMIAGAVVAVIFGSGVTHFANTVVLTIAIGK